MGSLIIANLPQQECPSYTIHAASNVCTQPLPPPTATIFYYQTNKTQILENLIIPNFI